jgi:hypothetical protein
MGAAFANRFAFHPFLGVFPASRSEVFVLKTLLLALSAIVDLSRLLHAPGMVAEGVCLYLSVQHLEFI